MVRIKNVGCNLNCLSAIKVLIVAMVLIFNVSMVMAEVNWQANPVGAVFAREGGVCPEGTYRLKSGGYEVYTIVSADKSYQPASLYYGVNDVDKQKVDAMVPDGKVPTSMNCFVVKTDNGYIMFDTGLPSSKGGKTLDRLASLNITPEEIKTVYITHGHFDHIGGLLDDNGKAVYSNAKLYVPLAELTFMRETMNEATARIESAYSGRLVSFEPGELLEDNVLPISAKGHTPGHTAYRLGNILFVGDLMHGPSIQLIDPTICAGYDADRNQAIISRNTILSYSVANSLTVLGAHIPINGVLF